MSANHVWTCNASRHTRLSALAQFAPQLICVGMVQIFEDVERFPPRQLRLPGVAVGVAGIAEMGENLRLEEAVAELPEQAERALVVGSRHGEVAKLMLGVTQAVPGERFTAAVAVFLVHGQGLSAEQPGLVRVAEHDLAPADGVECGRLPGLVGGGPEQSQRLLGVAERFGVTGLAFGHPVERLVDACLAAVSNQAIAC